MFLVNLLILWPRRIAEHFLWAGPLVARIVVGYTFMRTGWEKITKPACNHPALYRMAHPFPAFSDAVRRLLGMFRRSVPDVWPDDAHQRAGRLPLP